MTADNLPAANAVGIMQNDVKGFNLWMLGQKGHGFVDCRARRAVGRHSNNS
jgi:hypothetical protein